MANLSAIFACSFMNSLKATPGQLVGTTPKGPRYSIGARGLAAVVAVVVQEPQPQPLTGVGAQVHPRVMPARGVEVGEAHAAPGKLIEVGSDKALRPEAPDIGVALIIGEDRDDVRGRPFGSPNVHSEAGKNKSLQADPQFRKTYTH